MDYFSDLRYNAEMFVYDRFRDLWRQYSYWMYAYLNNIICGLENQEYVNRRVSDTLNNIFAEFEKYYPFEDILPFKTYLNNYLTYMSNLLYAIKSGDTQLIDESRSNLDNNVNQFSELFASINPYWDVQEWRDLINEHINLIVEQFSSSLNSCTTAIKFDENMINHIQRLSNYMAEGIINQFNI